MNSDEDIRVVEEGLRTHFLKYTRQAYHALSPHDAPDILDIGCGSGIPTVELARLSGGHVTGLDIDRAALDELEARVADSGLGDSITIIHGSSKDMPFPDESFDILWAEGSIFVLGFEMGLREWRRLLRPGGHLVVHDDRGDVDGKLAVIPGCGYELVEHFSLPDIAWPDEYFGPLERMMKELDPPPSEWVDGMKKEIERVKREPDRARSAYFIMRLA